MTMRCLPALVFVAGVSLAEDTVHPLDVKPGLWETSMTMKTSGMPPIPPDLLEKMTPQQKAMIEERMKARESQGPKTTVSKHCLTREKLNQPLGFGSDKGACKRTLATSSSTKQEIRIECTGAGMKGSGTIRIEALDREHARVTAHMTSGDGARAMTIDSTGTAKWLGEACDSESQK